MRIAQLSDLHLTGDARPLYGAIDTEAAFVAALAALRDLQRRGIALDLVLLTGDLASQGDPAAYQRLCQALAALPWPCAVLPGNHDDRVQLRRFFPQQTWSAGVLACATVDLAAGRILLLDSSVSGQTAGEVTAAHCNWLESVSDGRPALLALHHPPFTLGLPALDAISCAGGELLACWLARHPEVAAVLCGHAHRSVSTLFAGRPAVVAPSIAHQIAWQPEAAPDALAFQLEPGAFLIHDWRPPLPPITHRLPLSAPLPVAYPD
ncbi:phosphodiesterase [Dechloromonas sp. ZY10]|uniref:phosphodiesterase n=1 Tax=Dechloromonas aquae TaxID=2664436 RepID=UPI003528B551